MTQHELDKLLPIIEEWLEYDTVVGELYWRKRPSNRVSLTLPAGNVNNLGYRQIRLQGVLYHAHHLVWYLHKRCVVKQQIDHIDRNPLNNRIENLRDVSKEVNMANTGLRCDNTLGVKGVCYNARFLKPYLVQITRNGVLVVNSRHATLEEAQAVANKFYEDEQLASNSACGILREQLNDDGSLKQQENDDADTSAS